jgi:hypothetical protein
VTRLFDDIGRRIRTLHHGEKIPVETQPGKQPTVAIGLNGYPQIGTSQPDDRT